MAKKSMLSGEKKRFKGYYYPPNRNTGDFETAGLVFYFNYTDNKGKQLEQGLIMSGRVATSGSIFIASSTELDFKPDGIIKINNDEYSITTVKYERNPAYNGRALRNVSNITYIMELDTDL